MDSRIDLYHVSGLYFGFIRNGTIYDSDGCYLGWVEADGSAWRRDGRYIGELDRAGYLLRDLSRPAHEPRTPPRAPMPDLSLEVRSSHRGSYTPPSGSIDALPALGAGTEGGRD